MQRQVRGSSPKLERIAVTVAAMAIVAADRHVHREWAPTTPRLGLMQRTTSVPLNPRSTRGQEPKQAQHLPHRSLSANSVEVGARRGFSSLGDATTRCSRTVPFPLFSPHELLTRHQGHYSIVWGLFLDSVVNAAQISPRPPDVRGMGFAALSIVVGRYRDGDGLDRFHYSIGSGLSWNPMAFAFRSSALNILALILTAYSSIDWTTYSSPCLSIL
jgi:hypothetical protein